MRRTNTFRLVPAKEQKQRLHNLADNCSKMYNEINHKRRQSFFSGRFDWNTDEQYHKYKGLVGSATAQQITQKNNEAWKSYWALLKKWKKGKVEKKPKPPRYWKDRETGKRPLKILVRCDSYHLEGKTLKLPFGLKTEWRGRNRWKGGKQGRLEINCDELSEKWYAYMPVEIKPPLHQQQSIGEKKEAYVNLGVKVPIMANIEGEVFGYRANSMLSDWWYWTHRIAEHQSILKDVNNRSTSKLLKSYYRKRRRRFRNSVNLMVRDFVEKCWNRGVSEIVCGDLRDIRSSANFSRRSNSMIHNFWSVGYMVRRIEEVAEEYGIKITRVDERGTSSECPRCGSKRIVRSKRMFRCRDCGLEAHRDAVGCINIGLAHQQKEKEKGAEAVNRAVTRPTLLTTITIAVEV
ncbi:MAG: transposase [Candidatus Freyarchaeum deiterrae]